MYACVFLICMCKCFRRVCMCECFSSECVSVSVVSVRVFHRYVCESVSISYVLNGPSYILAVTVTRSPRVFTSFDAFRPFRAELRSGHVTS